MNKMYVTFRATKKAYNSPHTWRHFLHYLCWMRSVIHTCCFWRRAGVGQLIVFCIQYTKYKNITYFIYAYINYVYVSYICIYKDIGESSYNFTNIDMFILFLVNFGKKRRCYAYSVLLAWSRTYAMLTTFTGAIKPYWLNDITHGW